MTVAYEFFSGLCNLWVLFPVKDKSIKCIFFIRWGIIIYWRGELYGNYQV
jgi:hypothetical protein